MIKTFENGNEIIKECNALKVKEDTLFTIKLFRKQYNRIINKVDNIKMHFYVTSFHHRSSCK